MNQMVFQRRSDSNDPWCGINLGDKACDTVTGFTGVVMNRCEYLTGCNQVYLQPDAEKSNEFKEGHWFDIERVQKIEDGAVKIALRHTGSDTPVPSMRGRRV